MVKFFVPGVPKPAGSKRAFQNRKTGKIIVTDDCLKGRDWRGDVQAVAVREFRTEPLVGPLELHIDFYMPRPKGHYGKDGKLRVMAPRFVLSKPDATKLTRALEDALTGIVWRDDAQVVRQVIAKHYSDRPGALVEISEAEEF